MQLHRLLLYAVAAFATAFSCAQGQALPGPDVVAAPAASAQPAPPLPATSPPAESSPAPPATGTAPLSLPISVTAPATPSTAQTYTAFLHGAEHIAGVIDMLRKDDDVYFDLGPENFEHTYIIAPSLASGVGSGVFAGRVYEPFLVTFKRVGKRVLWLSPNTRYVAANGSAQAKSLRISVADSVLVSSPIVAEESTTGRVIISPSIFLTDFEGIGADLGRSGAAPSIPGLLLLGAHPSFAIDASKSYYAQLKGFPRNDEISVNLTFSGPPNSLPTVPDGRGIPLVVHYSIVTPPQADPTFVPRYADDRIGYFITARKRYDDDSLASPFERFIERWNLHRAPITFYLTDEIPQRYRATIKRGILAWNDAFTRIGQGAPIVVKDQPADSAWDPDDARYTTVRWITSDRPDFSAYSPSVVDPRDGQIIRAEVVIDGESLRTIKRGYVDTIVPLHRIAAAFAPVESTPQSEALCDYAGEAQSQAALGTMLLALHGHGSATDRERYADGWLFSTVMHEVGHTLGLRHNFAGSTAYTRAQLHDPQFTRAHSTTASVMDYTPVNLAAPGHRQADYFPARLGAYDYWAIAYGYTAFKGLSSSGQELPFLHAIAARSTRPGLAYGTDEDALEPVAVDPHIARFDLSNDPLGYDAEMLALNESLAQTLGRRYPGDTRSYQEIRASLVTILNNELSAVDLAARYIGGIYTSRAHRGQAGSAPPFVSISRSQAHRAFTLIDRYVFSAAAFRYSPGMLNELSTTRFGFHWDSGDLRRPDFPLREVVAEIQDDAIGSMFAAPNLARIADQSLKVSKSGDTMTLNDLFSWTNGAVFDDITSAADTPTHRELQRRFADLEMAIALLPSFVLDSLSVPREAQALARASLVSLSHRIEGARSRDPATQAHLNDLRSRIAGTLAPQTVRPL